MKSRRQKFTTMHAAKKKAKLGSGARFAALKDRLAARTGKGKVKNPGALAAYIGRKKYGAKRFAALAKK